MGRGEAPTTAAVRKFVNEFEITGSVLDQKPSEDPRKNRTEINKEIVFDDVLPSSTKSVCSRAQQLGISLRTVRRIRKQDLHLLPYKIQLVQELKPADHIKSREFVDRFRTIKNSNPNFHSQIIFSDKAHFHLSGFVNKQNCSV